MLVLDHQITSNRSLKFLTLLVLGSFIVLAVRLWYVQMVAVDRYQVDLNRQSFRMVRLPAIRGKIFDRNGIVLVDNRLSFQLKLYLEDIRKQFQDTYSTEKALYYQREGRGFSSPPRSEEFQRRTRYQAASNIVYQVTAQLGWPRILNERQFHNHYQRTRPLPMPIMDDMTSEQLALYLESTQPFPGVGFEIQSTRTNHYQSLAAHALGYLRRDMESDEEADYHYHYLLPDHRGSKAGVEGVFDESLRGEAGAKRIVINNYGYRQEERILKTAKPGKNLYLTLDLPIQMETEKALRAYSVRTKGAAVVVDVQTGDILAIASSPTFDPNWFIGSFPTDSDEYRHFTDPDLRPQINRATMGFYPPGSTFKMIVSLVCLENGLLDPEEPYWSAGYYPLGTKSRIQDTAAPGWYSFERAFKKSSNTYFIEFGQRAKKDALLKMAEEFGMGRRTGIPINAESAGYLTEVGATHKRNGRPWRPGDTFNLCIGQGEIAVTPIQLAMLTAAVANGGTLHRPRLVSRIVAQEIASQDDIEFFPDRQIANRISLRPESLRILHRAMRADVADGETAPGGTGSGYKADVPGMEICGKTGTAEIKDSTQDDKVTWFTSFAPLSSPKYAVVVAIESGASGGDACAPIARKIYQAIQRGDQNRATIQTLTHLN